MKDTHNPGKYDDLCTKARLEANADGALLIVINGNKGGGFSAQVDDRILPKIPEILEEVARNIRKQTLDS